MPSTNKKSDYSEASMDDILSSIRKYVTNEADDEFEDDEIFDLDIENRNNNQDTSITDNSSNNTSQHEESDTDSAYDKSRTSLFSKLAKALRVQKTQQFSGDISNVTVGQLFYDIAVNVVENWCEQNLRDIVEQMVSKEIEKLKSE